jgi:hypothetical protein
LSVVSIPSVAFVVQQFERPVGEFPGTAGQRGHPLGDGRSRSGFEFGWPTGPPAAEVPDDVPNDGLRLVVQFPEAWFVGPRILDRVEDVDVGRRAVVQRLDRFLDQRVEVRRRVERRLANVFLTLDRRAAAGTERPRTDARHLR